MAEIETTATGTLRTGIDGEASLAEARRLIGVDHRGARTTIEITEDNVRDYCSYIDSDNPLFLQPVRGRRSRWGRPLAPPTMIGTAIIAPGLKGVQWIYGGARWTFHRPFGPGDLIAQTGSLIVAELKAGRNAAQMIVQKGLTRCTNQHGELVAETEVVCMRIPRRRGKGGLSYAKREVKWTQGELEGFEERMELQAANVRGAEIRYWDDVQPGDTLPETVFGPLRMSDIALTRGSIVWGIVGGREQNGGYGYMLDHYRRHPADSYVNPETGATEHPHRGHWEQYMAEEVGMPGIYDVGYQRLGWLCRALTDWIGDDGRLRMLEGVLRKPTIVGDVTIVSGTVTGKQVRAGKGVVTLSVAGRNQTGEDTVVGTAEVELIARQLPQRSPTAQEVNP
jgi:acyl dehydratase